jgi:hypothetical protein
MSDEIKVGTLPKAGHGALPVCDLLLGTDRNAMPCASRLHTAWIGALAAGEQRKAE